jgi:hypothetical protein
MRGPVYDGLRSSLSVGPSIKFRKTRKFITEDAAKRGARNGVVSPLPMRAVLPIERRHKARDSSETEKQGFLKLETPCNHLESKCAPGRI